MTSAKSKYEVIRTLGEGGYGRALLVRCRTDPSKRYVMKEVRLSALKPKEREEARREAKVLAALRHPNIVQYVDSFEDGRNFYIVMEYADGGDLAQKIEKRGRKLFPEEEVLHDFIQIALAIKYIHDRKILHRDLKAQNVFLMKDGTVKLGDFGIARVLDNTAQLCKTQIGTPYYLSPEICEGKRYNSKTDIWSLGCILYELCALRHPFDAANINGLLMVIIHGKYKPIPGQYSENMKRLLAMLLTRNPEKRPSIKQVLGMPFIKNKLGNFLDQTLLEYEMGHTILHGRKPLAPPTIVLSKHKENDKANEANEPKEAPRSVAKTPLARKRVAAAPAPKAAPAPAPSPVRKAQPGRSPRQQPASPKSPSPLDAEEEKKRKRAEEIAMFKRMVEEREQQKKMAEMKKKREMERQQEEQKREEDRKAAEERARKAAFELKKQRQIAEWKREIEESERQKREAEAKKREAEAKRKRDAEAAERKRILEEQRQKAREEEERRKAQLEEEMRKLEEAKAQQLREQEEQRQRRLAEIEKKKAAERKRQAQELRRQRQERLARIRMERKRAEEEEQMEIARLQEEDEKRTRELEALRASPPKVQQSQSQDKLLDSFISRSKENVPSWVQGPTRHVELDPDDMTIAPSRICPEPEDDDLETLKIPPSNRKKIRIMSQDELDSEERRRIFEENKRERAENKAKMRGTPTDHQRKLSVNDGIYSRPIEELTERERYLLYKQQREERRQNQMKISGNAPMPRAGTPGLPMKQDEVDDHESEEDIDEQMLDHFSNQHNLAISIRDAYDLPSFDGDDEAEAGFEDDNGADMEFTELRLSENQTPKQRAEVLRAFLLEKIGKETLKKVFAEIRSYEEDENAETPICNGLDPEVFFMAQQLRFLENDGL